MSNEQSQKATELTKEEIEMIEAASHHFASDIRGERGEYCRLGYRSAAIKERLKAKELVECIKDAINWFGGYGEDYRITKLKAALSKYNQNT